MKFKIDREYNDALIDWGENCDRNIKDAQYIIDVDFTIPDQTPYYSLRWDGSAFVSQSPEWISDLASRYRIYDFMQEDNKYHSDDVIPADQNYDILGLFKQYTFVEGELSKIVYFSKYDFTTETYSDPVVTEYRTYFRQDDYYYKREIDIFWHRRDGSEGDSKKTVKMYTPQQAVTAGVRRRTYIVDQMKIEIAYMISQTESVDLLTAENMGKLLLKDYRDQIWDYKQGDTSDLIDAITNDSTHAWLDNVIDANGTTIRQYALDSINI